ncbi:MAG: hypothetical protein M3Y04_00625 [Actinomycetota bacterium]|nr:hypothetical protein [Actinomycetota bacterium]
MAQAGALAALALLATACSGGSDKVTVTAADYRFENLPKSVKAGTTLTLKNSSSKELHELVVVKLPDAEKRSAVELVKLPEAQFEALSPGPPALVRLRPPGGGPEIAALGDGKLTAKGRYLVICAILTGADPAAYLKARDAHSGGPPKGFDGAPHFTMGMYGEITVK